MGDNFNASVYTSPDMVSCAQAFWQIVNQKLPELIKDHNDGGTTFIDAIKSGSQYLHHYNALARNYNKAVLQKKIKATGAEKWEGAYKAIHEILKVKEKENYDDYVEEARDCAKKAKKYDQLPGRLDEEKDPVKRLARVYSVADQFLCDFMLPLMTHIQQVFASYEKSEKAGKRPSGHGNPNSDKGSGLQKIQVADVKGLSRTLEKSALRPNDTVPWDMVRVMCVCEDMKAICQVLKLITAWPSVLILEVNDRFSTDKNGWADCAVYITSKDAEKYHYLVGEIQIVHKGMLHVREELGAHDIYNDCRYGAELLKTLFNTKSEAVPWSQA